MNKSKNEKTVEAKKLLGKIGNLNLTGAALTEMTSYFMQMLQTYPKSGILGIDEEL